eukprot:2706938-Rhodomonas_salina.2
MVGGEACAELGAEKLASGGMRRETRSEAWMPLTLACGIPGPTGPGGTPGIPGIPGEGSGMSCTVSRKMRVKTDHDDAKFALVTLGPSAVGPRKPGK